MTIGQSHGARPGLGLAAVLRLGGSELESRSSDAAPRRCFYLIWEAANAKLLLPGARTRVVRLEHFRQRKYKKPKLRTISPRSVDGRVSCKPQLGHFSVVALAVKRLIFGIIGIREGARIAPSPDIQCSSQFGLFAGGELLASHQPETD